MPRSAYTISLMLIYKTKQLSTKNRVTNVYNIDTLSRFLDGIQSGIINHDFARAQSYFQSRNVRTSVRECSPTFLTDFEKNWIVKIDQFLLFCLLMNSSKKYDNRSQPNIFGQTMDYLGPISPTKK